MSWHKWHRTKRWCWGATKRDRAREQKRHRTRARLHISSRQRLRELDMLPLRERFWEAWDVWNYD